jgi:hypothetical protein
MNDDTENIGEPDGTELDKAAELETPTLAARGFTELKDNAVKLAGAIEALGAPAEFEEAIAYARDARARGMVRGVPHESLERIDLDLLVLEHCLDLRAALAEYAGRAAARSTLDVVERQAPRGMNGA